MQVPVQISFRDMPVSDEVETHCWSEAEKLERIDDRVTACRIVVVESKQRATGRTVFRVRIDLSVAGGAVVVDREPPTQGNDDIRLAIHEAFVRAQHRLVARPTPGFSSAAGLDRCP